MKLVDIEPYKGKVIASHTYCGVNKLIEVDALEEISEQEIVKPILDKIRAEIEQAAGKQFQIAMGVSDLNERYAHIQMETAYRHCLNVIDKYKAESEVTE